MRRYYDSDRSSHYSLRRQLLAWIGIPVIIATCLSICLSYWFSKHEILEVYDAQLVHSAKVLLQLTEHEITQDREFNLGLENPDLAHRYERNLAFRIWVGNDLITESPNTKDFKSFEANPGFSNHTIGKHEWRFFVFLDPVNQIKIEVSERTEIRTELIIQLMVSLLIPSFLFMPVILFIIWIGVSKVLKPVIKISAAVDQRSSEDLSAMPFVSLPKEIAPLILALNGLFKRLEESFKHEREFTDHAAHELRTPLAAMKTQTQVLMKQSKHMPEFEHGLANLQASINRAIHLVEQLLSLARLQHETLERKPCNLSDLLKEAVDSVEQIAQEKGVTLHHDIAADYGVVAHDESIAILLRNVLDNAVKYTPRHGRVDIVLSKTGLLTIADTGSGLSDSDKERVFERFVRADKTGQTGSGLGLSIVKWIADAHSVDIKISDNKPNGLIMSLAFDAL